MGHRNLGRFSISFLSDNRRRLQLRQDRRKNRSHGRLLTVESLENRDLLTVASSLYLPATEHLVTPGEFLTKPSLEDPLAIAVEYLSSDAAGLGLKVGQESNFEITDQFVSSHTGTTHIYFSQTYNGLSVENASININIAADGQVISAGGGFVEGLNKGEIESINPKLTPGAALKSLAGEFDWAITSAPSVVRSSGDHAQSTVLGSSGVSLVQIPVELHYVPSPGGGVELSWKLNVQTVDGEHWYDVSVNADSGELNSMSDWVDDLNSYNVFPAPVENPDDGSRALVVDPANLTASPFGWHDTDGVVGAEFTDTRGNNVFAQEDANGNNSGGFRPDGGASLDFDFPLDLGLPPASNQSAAITNLFLWNNTLHDIFFQYGFDEAGGNFQVTNYSGLGAGGDPVQADGLDGSGTNNANFATPPDGFDPRMQMFLWTLTSPGRDGDFDNVIITHEYGHGVSNRLTGGPANSNALNAAQSGGMGEGWSDWWGLMMTQKPSDGQFDSYTVGTYVLGQPTNGSGIRNFPYSFDLAVNPQTYGDISSTNQPHGVGEIWAQVLFDMNWLLINGDGGSIPAQGFDSDLYNGTGGNNVALQLVMDGLKIQPANPSFLDARDAILQADLVSSGGANHLAIWTAFARRGMGFSAFDGGSSSTVNVTEAFDLPATSEGTVELDAESYEVGDPVTILLRDIDLIGGTQNVLVTSSGGDSESVALAALGAGVFEGTISTAASFTAGNGVLEVAAGDVITVTYDDADDGSGNPATVTDNAEIILLVDIFSQDFESGLGAGEQVSGAFTINNTNAPLNNGTMMMGHPTTHGNFEYSAYQVSVNLAGVSNAQLEFDYTARIEDFFDGFNVQASTSPISPPGDLITPASGMAYDSASTGAAPQLGLLAYDGNGALDTGTAVFDLSAFDGQTVKLRFQFGSDFSVVRPGINIDNLLVRGTPVSSVTLSAPTPGTAGSVNSIEVTGATPGGLVTYVAGFFAGSTVTTVGTFDIANARKLGTEIATAGGFTTLSRFIPAHFAGQEVLIQAIDRVTGNITNLVTHTFASPVSDSQRIDDHAIRSRLRRQIDALDVLSEIGNDGGNPILLTASHQPTPSVVGAESVDIAPQKAPRSRVVDEVFAALDENDFEQPLDEELLENLLQLQLQVG